MDNLHCEMSKMHDKLDRLLQLYGGAMPMALADDADLGGDTTNTLSHSHATAAENLLHDYLFKPSN